MYRKVYRLVLFLLLISVLNGCVNKQQGEHISDTRLLLDTYCTITIHGDVDLELLNEAFSLCAEMEALFSMTIEGSDIWRLNHAEGESIEIDSRTYQVIQAGQKYSELSGGMFDINIGRLTRLWDFGSGKQNVPTESELSEALTLSESEAWIDLGAISKGYIADRIAELLVQRGVAGAMIDLGGDVFTVGNRADGNPWRIALKKPYGTSEDWIGVVEVSNLAVVTSGTYERSFEKDGVIYHHILDPFTGMPVQTDVVSAAVIAESAMVGEGLSTIAVLLGSERTPELFRQSSGFIGAVLILENGDILRFGDVEILQFADKR